MSQNGDSTTEVEDVAPSNELDIDDGTMPIEDTAQADETDDTAVDQVAGDDAGDTDATQRDETDDTTEEAPAQGDEPAAKPEPKAEAKPEAKPATPAAPSWQAHYDQIVEEFGETAAAPFKAIIEPLVKQVEAQQRIIDSMTDVATKNVRQSEIAYVENLCAEAGIKGKGSSVYEDAETIVKLRSQQGKPISPLEAVKQAIRLNGGRDKSTQPASKTMPTAADKAARLERLRSVPPKARASAPIDFDNDDPATIDGTAPSARR